MTLTIAASWPPGTLGHPSPEARQVADARVPERVLVLLPEREEQLAVPAANGGRGCCSSTAAGPPAGLRAARHQAPHCPTGTAWLGAAPSCDGVHLPRSLSCLERLDKFGQHLTDIADDAQVGDREYRGLWVLVDGDDVPGGLHPDDMLDGT